ncbi:MULTISPECIES: CapA family protein [Paenibacillus]|uniref:CapA family protein n=1 Tax=Paenibacillus TaxID=44249 RepID=UPI0022B86BB5|nr:CapA family protein [Paenibacillus caseinilyticus]MCZ8522770.1 CapA family protein [Paenibacillus caseinilyticus]
MNQAPWCRTARLCGLLTLLLLPAAGCGGGEGDKPAGLQAEPGWFGAENQAAGETPAGPPIPSDRIVSLAAVGDVLIHRPLYEDARTRTGFDFSPMLAAVRQELQHADVAVANQESVTGGAQLGLSDYPSFNSPQETADALKEAGIDVVTMANNHALDRGEKALRSAIRHWRELGVEYAGASESMADRSRLRVVEKNGVKLAFLAFTQGTNGISPPPGKAYLVHRTEERRMRSDIAEARKAADAVVVSLHWGREYERLPSAEQRKLAKLAADAGADIIIGHHPHVLQPLEWIGNNRGGRSLVVYSLGNFLAAQQQPDLFTRIGAILHADLRLPSASADGTLPRVLVEGVRLQTTFIRSRDWHGFRVVPLAEAGEADLPRAVEIRSGLQTHLQRWMPELTVR